MEHRLFPKSALASAALLAAIGGNAHAGAGIMVGLSHNFGGETGFTLKVLSTDRKDKFAAAVGVSYYPWAQTRSWGVDTSVGYTFRNGAVTLGYDWLNEKVQVGLGAANTKKTPAPAVVPAPPPASGPTGSCGPFF